MGLLEKIEEIRQKPEHIRLRYVWVMVAISMVFILFIWIMSLKANQAMAPSPEAGILTPELQESWKSQKESLKENQQQFQEMLEEAKKQVPDEVPTK